MELSPKKNWIPFDDFCCFKSFHLSFYFQIGIASTSSTSLIHPFNSAYSLTRIIAELTNSTVLQLLLCNNVLYGTNHTFVTHLTKNFQTTLHTDSLFPYFTPPQITLNVSSFQFPI